MSVQSILLENVGVRNGVVDIGLILLKQIEGRIIVHHDSSDWNGLRICETFAVGQRQEDFYDRHPPPSSCQCGHHNN